MTHAMIFDAVRTPRGKGKKDGSLHEVKPVDLLARLLTQLQKRHRFDPAQLDDIVMGVVSPVGEQGSVIAKTAALKAGWDFRVAGMQINRFCASGLEAVNLAAQKVASGWEDMVIAGGVESMSRVPIGSDGGAWAQDPETNFATGFVPQGIGADLIATLGGWDRDDVDRYALTSQQRAAAAQAEGRFDRSVLAVEDSLGLPVLERDEFIKPRTTLEGLGQLKVAFGELGALGFDAVALARYPHVERIRHVHTAGNSSGIVDGEHRAIEAARALRRRRALLRRQRVAVDVLAIPAGERRDQVGADALRDEADLEVRRRVLRPGTTVAADRHARHALDAAGDDQVFPAARDLLRRDVDGLEARCAEAVDLHPRHLEIPARLERRRLGDHRALLADG